MEECRSYAIHDMDVMEVDIIRGRIGIWGGMSPDELAAARREARGIAA
jgi:hypothetical protein